MQKQFSLRKHQPSHLLRSPLRVTRPQRWVIYAAALGLAAAATIWWTKAQVVGGAQSAPTSLEELRNIELTDPTRFAALMEQTKTPEDRQQEYYARLGISDAPAYLALFPKSAAEIERDARAAVAITHPPTIEEAMRTITPAQQQEFQRSLDAILHPPQAQGN